MNREIFMSNAGTELTIFRLRQHRQYTVAYMYICVTRPQVNGQLWLRILLLLCECRTKIYPISGWAQTCVVFIQRVWQCINARSTMIIQLVTVGLIPMMHCDICIHHAIIRQATIETCREVVCDRICGTDPNQIHLRTPDPLCGKSTRFICFTVITVTSQWVRWRLKSPASRLFIQPFIQAQIKENIEAPRHWPLCGEFTGDQWISRTNGQ